MDMIASSIKITFGTAARLSKPRWIVNGKISEAALHLRDGDPPEKFVSFNHSTSHDKEKIRDEATKILVEKNYEIRRNSRFFYFDINEALKEINYKQEVISFEEKDMPHCGLVYTSSDSQEIQEAKSTLCLIAKII